MAELNVKIELNEVNILLKLLRQAKLVSVLAEATVMNESGITRSKQLLPETLNAGIHKNSQQFNCRQGASERMALNLLSQGIIIPGLYK